MYGILSGLAFFLFSGMVTAVIPNSLFRRMTQVTALDYIFLTVTSILVGIFVALHFFHRGSRVCTASAVGGGIGGFVGFSCTVCNRLLVLVLGVTGVLAFVEPYRPLIGLLGIGLLGFSVVLKIKDIRKPG
jgi:hypothetical protein